MTSVSKREPGHNLNNSKTLKGLGSVGPGSYSPKSFEKSAAYKNMNYPPFMIQDDRWSPDKAAIKNNIPGPGAYSLAGDMNKGKMVSMNTDKGTYYIQDANTAQK